MDSEPRWIVPLEEAVGCDHEWIGGKAAHLARLTGAGFRVPAGFCVTTRAYGQFLAENRLDEVIRMELGRKPLDQMRWEEIWDTALRIRSAFLGKPVPPVVVDSLSVALDQQDSTTRWAVRSSAPGEDSEGRSFAGLHESYLDVTGREAMVDAVRLVWASLWSDAALLYRRELSLDPSRSRMAVLIQPMRTEACSGVAFGRDPRHPERNVAVVEAVPGPCSGLVDGRVDPDRWIVDRSSGKVLEYHGGSREGQTPPTPLLEEHDLAALAGVVGQIERLFGWAADVEWTGREDRLTVLQARPITRAAAQPDDQRAWYLSLRPSEARLETLRRRVVDQWIPQLKAEGDKLAGEDLDRLSDQELAAAIDRRLAAVQRWKKVYWDDFIPFAHGVRRLATYYNDAVRPQDPYEFVGLLRGEPMLATRRNQSLEKLADALRENQALADFLDRAAAADPAGTSPAAEILQEASGLPGGRAFVEDFQRLQDDCLDVAYRDQRLADRPDLLLRTVLELARSGDRSPAAKTQQAHETAAQLDQRLMDAVGPARRREAAGVLEMGRLSWRLRDDDNLLLARIESQLLRALQVATDRLRSSGRMDSQPRLSQESAPAVSAALRDPAAGAVVLPQETRVPATSTAPPRSEKARQLVGQPAAPGVATGTVRRIRSPEDLGRFHAGEALVCDAIQPMMTHLVPLACAVVERRGGMLIHGAIIARELGIPCVNGILRAVESLSDGELITVDGHLGIVTVGPPEFDLELEP